MADIECGQFREFHSGLIVAELSGASVDRESGMLATRPPFRDSKEYTQIHPEDLPLAEKMAIEVCGIHDLAIKVREAYPVISHLIASKSGVLAVHMSSKYVDESDKDLVSHIDDNNRNLLFGTRSLKLAIV